MTTWNDVLAWAKTSTRPNGDCQGFAANDFVGKFGSFKVGYGSANAAMAASKAAGTFHTGTPPQGRVVWVYFAFPTYGHVALYYNGTILMDSSQCTAWLNAKKTVGTAPLSHYSYAYLGYSTTNGANTIPQIPTPAATNKRTVATGGVYCRTAPSSSASSRGLVKAGTVLTFSSYVEGENVDSDPYWLYAEGNATQLAGWYWLGGMTDHHVAGIPLGKYTPPVVVKPPVVTPPPVTTPPVVTPPPVTTPPVVTPPVDDEPVDTTPDEPPVDTGSIGILPDEPPVDTMPDEPPAVTPPKSTAAAETGWAAGLVALVGAIIAAILALFH